MEEYFYIYSNCVFATGDNGIVLIDLQRGEIYNIPELFYEVYSKMREHNFNENELKLFYLNQYDKGIDEFFNFFKDIGVAFISDNNFNQKELEIKYEYPGLVKTLVIDIDEFPEPELILEKINNLYYKGLRELEILINRPNEKLEELLGGLELSPIKSVQIHIKNICENINYLENLLENYKRISRIITTNEVATNNKRIFCKSKSAKINFIVNIKHYCESHFYNTYNNKMVFVDENGSFYTKGLNGNNKFDISFPPKIWRINKDKVEGCKRCKLRYICFDSVGINENNGVFLRNEKCDLFPELF
jgi:hypothetical protein